MTEPHDVRAEIDSLRSEVERLAAELTDMRAHTSLLESLAQEDPLTGLLNRQGFFRDLARAVAYQARYGTPIAILVVDLDDFKPINDQYGHEAGDRALVHASTLIRNNVRASDAVGRLGGDEFAMILWQVDEANARLKAASLEALVAASPVNLGAVSVTLGCSIGVAMVDGKDTAEDALTRADHAMYARKAERKSSAR